MVLERVKGGWICRCDCGNKTFAGTSSLRFARKRSCGCLVNEQRVRAGKANFLGEGIAARNALIAHYRKRAERKRREFLLTDEQCDQLFKGNCHYCGKNPECVRGSWSSSYVYNTIDRKDNGQGYSIENCVSSCMDCNRSKRDKSYASFMESLNGDNGGTESKNKETGTGN